MEDLLDLGVVEDGKGAHGGFARPDLRDVLDYRQFIRSLFRFEQQIESLGNEQIYLETWHLEVGIRHGASTSRKNNHDLPILQWGAISPLASAVASGYPKCVLLIPFL